MPVYRISAEEVITYIYEVEADSPEDARAKVEANHSAADLSDPQEELADSPYRLFRTNAFESGFLQIDPGYPIEIDPTNDSDLPGSAIPEYWNNDKEKV